MTRSLYLALVAALAGALVLGERAQAQGRVTSTLWSATEVLEAFQAIPLKSIPPALLRDAQGIAVIPGVIKLGFVAGGRFGQGVVLARTPDGGWSNPVFVSLAGGSIGWQAGVQSTDVILVFKTRRGLDRVLQGKGKLTLGADAAVAAGPLGRQAEADTDALLRAEIYSYSRSRGLFAGVALEGAGILCNPEANRAFSQHPRPEDLQAAARLRGVLMAMTGVPVPPPVLIPAPILSPPQLVPTPPPAPTPPPPPGRPPR